MPCALSLLGSVYPVHHGSQTVLQRGVQKLPIFLSVSLDMESRSCDISPKLASLSSVLYHINLKPNPDLDDSFPTNMV